MFRFIGKIISDMTGSIVAVFIIGGSFSLAFIMMDAVAFNCVDCAHIIIKPLTNDRGQLVDNLWQALIGFEIAGAILGVYWGGRIVKGINDRNKSRH